MKTRLEYGQRKQVRGVWLCGEKDHCGILACRNRPEEPQPPSVALGGYRYDETTEKERLAIINRISADVAAYRNGWDVPDDIADKMARLYENQ